MRVFCQTQSRASPSSLNDTHCLAQPERINMVEIALQRFRQQENLKAGGGVLCIGLISHNRKDSYNVSIEEELKKAVSDGVELVYMFVPGAAGRAAGAEAAAAGGANAAV